MSYNPEIQSLLNDVLGVLVYMIDGRIHPHSLVSILYVEFDRPLNE